MDNITHTLAGLVLAESVVQARHRVSGVNPSGRFRLAAAVSSAFAANLPDVDILYTGKSEPLRYLLHHRGYTHTIVAAALGAVVVWWVASMVWRWRAGVRAERGDAAWLGSLLVVSVLSHLLLDWTNSYGVHLFWPVDNRWQYGDAVFIVEPWLWVVSIPVLMMASPRRLSRALLSVLLLVALVLAWTVDLVSATAAAALTTGTLLSIVVARALPAPKRTVFAVVSWCAVTLVMAASAARARAVTLHSVHALEPAGEILDVVVSPLPANAVCLSVIVAERVGDIYRVVTGRVSVAPALAPAGACGQRGRSAGLFRPSSRPSSDAVQWDGEWTAPAAELATLARESCPVLAGLRFMRIPVWTLAGDMVVLGDARYGGGAGGSFSDIRVPRHSAECPKGVPPWIPPRDDLIGTN